MVLLIIIILVIILLALLFSFLWQDINNDLNSMSLEEILKVLELSEDDIEEATKMSFVAFKYQMSYHTGYEQYKELLRIKSFLEKGGRENEKNRF